MCDGPGKCVRSRRPLASNSVSRIHNQFEVKTPPLGVRTPPALQQHDRRLYPKGNIRSSLILFRPMYSRVV